MVFTRASLGHLEVPDFILVKASEERIGVLNCTSKKWHHIYNGIDTLSFEIPYMTDGVVTSFYNDIDVMKYIEVLTVGRFCIKDIEIVNEGQNAEYKSVECQDYSALLATRYVEELSINEGLTGSIDNVKFYQPGNQPYSLLHLVVAEKFPEWSFGYISPSLQTMKRSFNISRKDVYSFLTNDVSNAFECVFVFNSLTKTINAYLPSEYGQDTNIHVSYNNLLEHTEMSYSTDEIKTAVTLKGDDDLDVREINLGYSSIYNFSAYASEEFWSASLLSAYTAWNNLVNSPVDLNLFTYKTGVITRAELQGKTYNQAYTLLLSKYQDFYTQLSKWNSTMLPYLITSRKNPGYGTISYTEDGSDAVTISKQTATQLVNSLPSSGNANTLYLIKNTNNMYRWNGSWVDVNKWYNCCLAELKTLQAGAEKLQATAMKAGYGNPDDLNVNNQKRYVDTFLPALYMYNALTKQIEAVNSTIATLESNQAIIQTDKTVIVNKVAMKNNFTAAQLKELSAFIREDEISSDNFVVTDGMTESERFDMLYALLDYGQKELAKVAAPQIQFSADLINLFAIPEFDDYSGDFDVGNYVWVTLRDDYSVKARILEIEFNFLDQSDFAVTFGNVAKRARNIFTDVTDALNTATAAATSVSFGASNWNAASEETDSIGKALADGLLSQSYYLANAEDNETLIDENGLWITTTTGSHGRQNTDNYDSIYLGGGRILYTEDGWRTVSMSVGRADVSMPSINSQGELVYTTESKFGVFADFVIAGYIGGSLIVGGDIYSANYKTSSNKNSGNRGTHINLNDGTFEFNDKTSGRKRLTLSGDTLEMNGIVRAREGNIGSDDNGAGGFIIKHEKFYMDKESFNSTNNGVYIGFDSHNQITQGISLGAYNSSTQRNPFSVDVTGKLTSTSGYIGGFTITDKTLYYAKSSFDANTSGVYIGFDGSDNSKKGISLGKYNSSTNKSPFSVDVNGYLHAEHGEIGGFTLNSTSIYKGKTSLNDTDHDGIYIGNDGIALRSDNRFLVDTVHNTAKIAGFDFNNRAIYNGKTSLYDTDNAGVYIGTDGISLGRYASDGTTTNPFSVTSSGYLTARSGVIGGWTIGTNTLSANNITISAGGSIYQSANGESNWGISSGGSAYFKDVFITGVQENSTFGHMGYSGGDYNWGTFGGLSYYGCNDDIEPFSGGAIGHIERLAVEKLEVEWLDAGTIKAELLTADHITTGTLDASQVTVTNLDASNITTGTLDASLVTVTNLDADNITTGEIDGERVVINNAKLHYGVAIQGDIDWNNNSIGTAVISGITVLTYGED